MGFETARKGFNEIIEHWETKEFGTWSIAEKENPLYVIGFGGLSYRLYADEKKLNLGYRFDKKYWGKGYATELAQNAIKFGFTKLKLKEIFAIVRPKHLASVSVLQKCKMFLVEELDDAPNQEKSLVFKIEKNFLNF
jgi:[ribosomal protein S5]-alanine N-acetyltransferase